MILEFRPNVFRSSRSVTRILYVRYGSASEGYRFTYPPEAQTMTAARSSGST